MQTNVHDSSLWPGIFPDLARHINQIRAENPGIDLGPVTADSLWNFFDGENWVVVVHDEELRLIAIGILWGGFDLDAKVSRLVYAFGDPKLPQNEIAEVLALRILAEVQDETRGTIRVSSGHKGGITALVHHLLAEKIAALPK